MPGLASGAITVVGPNVGFSAINTDLLTGAVNGWFDASMFHSGSLTIIGSAGISAGVLTFEQTNDITLAPAGFVLNTFNASVINANPVTTLTVAASTNYQIEFPILAKYVRARISTGFTGGTVSVVAVFSPLPFAATRYNVQQATGASLVVSTTALVPGTAATNLGKAEDAVAASGDTGVAILAVRRDTLASSTSAAGDYAVVSVDNYGAALTRGYEKHAKTYSAAANITVAASATDIAIIPGNASTTVFITKILVSGIQTTAGMVEFQLIKRSTANSGGTSSGMAAVPHDATDAAASSVPLAYTANPTPGTAVGPVRRAYVPIGTASALASNHSVFDFGDNGKPIVLSGTAQGLAISLNGVTVTGGFISISIEWFEI